MSHRPKYLALAVLLAVSAGCLDAQSSIDAYPELDPELARLGPVSYRALPGAERADPTVFRRAISEATSIVAGAEGFDAKADALARLAHDPAFADEPEAVQMITGIALNWLNNNPSEWSGSEPLVREIVARHAESGGVMFEAMVDALDRLDAAGAEGLAPARVSVLAAYTMRKETCDTCDLDGPMAGPDSDVGHLPPAIVAQARAASERRTRAIQTLDAWLDE